MSIQETRKGLQLTAEEIDTLKFSLDEAETVAKNEAADTNNFHRAKVAKQILKEIRSIRRKLDLQ